MARYTPNYFSPPPELASRGIDFLTKVSTASVSGTPSLEVPDSEVSPSDAGANAGDRAAPSYGTMMFRRPSRAELDQGYSVDEYFLTSPAAIESPFQHKTPVEVGLMTQETPRGAIKYANQMDEPVLYGDVNSVMNSVRRGLSNVITPVSSGISHSWNNLSEENKDVLRGLGLVGLTTAAVTGLNRWAGTRSGRNVLLSRALSRGGGAEASVDVGQAYPMENALVAGTYGSADGTPATAGLISDCADDVAQQATVPAALMMAQASERVIGRGYRPVATVPIDFFRMAYQLGTEYNKCSSVPDFSYSFASGDPITSIAALKYLKAPRCYLDSDGGLTRCATPYALPVMLAGGEVWNKIKSGIKKIGGKLIDGAKKLMDSPIGSAITSLVPWGGTLKTIVNGASKVKDFVSGLTSGKSEATETAPRVEAPTQPEVIQVVAAAPTENGEPVPTQGATQTDVENDAAQALIDSIGSQAIDELDNSSSSSLGLPTSWLTKPELVALGSSLAERVANITRAVAQKEAGGGDPRTCLTGHPIAAGLAFLAKTAMEAGVWWGVGEGLDLLREKIREWRSSGDELPPSLGSEGDAMSAMEILQQLLIDTAAVEGDLGDPYAGGGKGRRRPRTRGRKRSGGHATSPAAPSGSAPGKQRAKELGVRAASAALKAAKAGGRLFCTALKKAPVLTLGGCAGAAFVADSWLNRELYQRQDTVKAVEQTLTQLSQDGYSEVADPLNQWVMAHKQVIVDDPENMPQAGAAKWSAIVQYCYLALLRLPETELSGEQRDLLQRCQVAGENLSESDYAAYKVLEDILGGCVAAAVGDEVPDPSGRERADDVLGPAASSDRAAADARALAASLGLAASLPPEALIGLRASNDDQGAESAEEEADAVPGDGDENDVTDVEAGEFDRISDAQLDAVEQAATVLALPTDGAEAEQRGVSQAMKLLTAAGLSGATASLVISLINRAKNSEGSRSGVGPFPSAAHWSSAAGYDPRTQGSYLIMPY